MALSKALIAIATLMVASLKEKISDEEIMVNYSDKKIGGVAGIGERSITEEELKQCLDEAKKMLDAEINGAKNQTKKEGKFKVPESWKGCIVVRQSTNIPGHNVEDPKSVKHMPYKPDVYERLVKSDGFKGQNIEVIHKPE